MRFPGGRARLGALLALALAVGIPLASLLTPSTALPLPNLIHRPGTLEHTSLHNHTVHPSPSHTLHTPQPSPSPPQCCVEYYGALPCSNSQAGNFVLMIVYGGVLLFAAKLIADGSELLLEVISTYHLGGHNWGGHNWGGLDCGGSSGGSLSCGAFAKRMLPACSTSLSVSSPVHLLRSLSTCNFFSPVADHPAAISFLYPIFLPSLPPSVPRSSQLLLLSRGPHSPRPHSLCHSQQSAPPHSFPCTPFSSSPFLVRC